MRVSLRFITGKSAMSRPNTHRNAADMPAIAQQAWTRKTHPINLLEDQAVGGIIALFMSTRFFTNEDENAPLKNCAGVFTHNPEIERFDALVG